jgi:serine/threonine-protein kinase
MVGCVAYWMLTGKMVFDGDTPIALISSHIHSEPEPVSARSDALIPSDLEKLVMQCLAKDPKKRPQSARDLRQRLREVPLDDPWTADRARAWWDEHDPG